MGGMNLAREETDPEGGHWASLWLSKVGRCQCERPPSQTSKLFSLVPRLQNCASILVWMWKLIHRDHAEKVLNRRLCASSGLGSVALAPTKTPTSEGGTLLLGVRINIVRQFQGF